jgi:CCR4-NOT transcriptional regulation complex NOT5 subunit
MEDGKYIDRFADGTIKEGIYENYKIIIPQEEPKQETLNKINNMGEEIKKQINLLEEEQTRVKQFINENNFNCTTAPWVIAKQYRDEIKKHIGILKMNLEN